MRYIPTKKVIRFSKWKLRALKFPFFIGQTDAPYPNQINAMFINDIPGGSLLVCDNCSGTVECTEEFGTPTFCKCGKELGYSHGNEW